MELHKQVSVMMSWTGCMGGFGSGMGWGMGFFAILLLVALVLTIAALAKYVFATSR